MLEAFMKEDNWKMHNFFFLFNKTFLQQQLQQQSGTILGGSSAISEIWWPLQKTIFRATEEKDGSNLSAAAPSELSFHMWLQD